MKCSNCGEPVEEGRLFCLNCGQEIQWVPDYDSFGTFMEQQERLKKEKEEAERREKLRAAAAAEAARKRKKKKRKIALAAGGTALVVILAAALGFKWYTDQKNYNSFDYQMRRAQSAFNSQEYERCYDFASRAVELDRDHEEASLLLARTLVELGREDEAAQVLEELIDQNPDSSDAYGELLTIYSDAQDTQAIKTLMDDCENEEIRSTYSEYIASEPVFSLPEGDYEQKQTLQLYTKADGGTIYYTTDGSEPTQDSQQYTSGIELEEGSTTVKAIVVNDRGISSDVVTRTYDIQLARPDPPQIAPSSGEYTTDMDTTIYVIVPEGCTAYYAFDEKPTVNSSQYTDGVQMLEGTHVFYAILQDENGKVSSAASITYSLTDGE